MLSNISIAEHFLLNFPCFSFSSIKVNEIKVKQRKSSTFTVFKLKQTNA